MTVSTTRMIAAANFFSTSMASHGGADTAPMYPEGDSSRHARATSSRPWECRRRLGFRLLIVGSFASRGSGRRLCHCEQARARGARILTHPTDFEYREQQYSAEELAGQQWTFSETRSDVA